MKNNYNLYLILAMFISAGVSLVDRLIMPVDDVYAFVLGIISIGLLFQYFNKKYCK